MKHIAITDFLTDEEIERARVLWQELRDTGRFAATLEETIVRPQLPRINAALGQENDARYLAYAVEYVFTELDKQNQHAPQPPPGHLWEWAEDVCKVCDAHIGHGLRFMHLGLCDRCAAATKH
jgi:hypothetical protein